MLGALVLLMLNLVVLRLAGGSARDLGLDRPGRRSLEFIAGWTVAALFVVLQMAVLARLAGFEWTLNAGYGSAALLEGLRWNTTSVLFEELIFRGALLWLAVRWLGPGRGTLLSAAAFGVYHWFSYGLFGALVPMIYVFLLTGTFGLMLARAYVWSGSILLPIALHLGWNLVNNELFSNGPMGQRLLIASTSEAVELGGLAQTLLSVVIPLALPVLVLLLLRGPLHRWRFRIESRNLDGREVQ